MSIKILLGTGCESHGYSGFPQIYGNVFQDLFKVFQGKEVQFSR